jgi:lysophospholipase L1-like esterase
MASKRRTGTAAAPERAGSSAPAEDARISPRSALLASLLGLLLALLLAEGVARIYVPHRFTAEQIAVLTMHTSIRGRYAAHPGLPYVLRPSYPSHNSWGWKGKEFQLKKPPGTKRVVCLGESTTYGGDKPYAEALEDLLRRANIPVEVLNAGVPGWTSREVLINFRERVLPLKPDLVILYVGRNDLIPQAYNDYRPDYSHFRDPYADFTRSNYRIKNVVRFSRLALLLVDWKPGWFGWDRVAEHPVYCTVRWGNYPKPEQIVANLRDPGKTDTFRSNVEAIVSLAKERGIPILLSTFAFIPERLKLEFLPVDPMIFEPMRVQLQRNNQAVREVASKLGAHLVDGEQLLQHPEVFTDDCHVTDAGDSLRARIFFDGIVRDKLLE